MGLTERQRQCFIHATNGQIENAVLEHYERARNAKTLQGEMYWWTAVFHSSRLHLGWTPKGQAAGDQNIAANLVREMIMSERERNNVRHHDRFDDVIYGVNKDTEQEIKFIEKRENLHPSTIVPVPDPQMHEVQPDAILGLLLLLQDLMEDCPALEIRALAYFLYKSELDKYLDYLDEEKSQELFTVMEELYDFVSKKPIDKTAFIGGSRWHTKKAEEALQARLNSLLPNERKIDES